MQPVINLRELRFEKKFFFSFYWETVDTLRMNRNWEKKRGFKIALGLFKVSWFRSS
jgi:hypothetical protein